ncbi:MAG: helix-turn-helix domain-containing protein [Candidatus Levybacteria bacterium]|nr:helix-turn-helix domain-containing protein [Candidatus Levybacteria bacterium]
MNGRKVTLDEIRKIKLLRSQGYSIIEIGNKLKRPKTTIFRYVRGVKILPEFLKNWAGKRGGSRKRKILKEIKSLKEAKDLIRELSYKEKFILLSALYWGEGSKRDFGLSNTDPNLIRVFIGCLKDVFKIDKTKLRVSIRIYEDINKEKCLKFWSSVTGVRKENFVNVNILAGKKKGKLEYGMCRVRVTKGGDFLKMIKSINKVVADLIVPIAQMDRASHS